MISPHVTAAEWDAFVHAHPYATAYHPWAWRGVFERTFGHETHYLAASTDGQITGVLPLVAFRSLLFGRYVVSLPFVNYGGLVVDDNESAEALLEAALDRVRAVGAAYVELRHAGRLLPALPARAHKVAMRLPLPSSAGAAWDDLDRKIRNQVRKAERSGLEVTCGGRDLVDAFYRVFAENMRDLGTPVYPRRFFAEVLEQFADRAACVVVTCEHRSVAAAITLRWRDTVEVPWASSLRAFKGTSANMLLYWTLIQRAIDTGAATFDFGRSSPDSGTFAFKRQWGAVPHQLHWEYGLAPGQTLPDLSPANPRFARAVAAWKRLPLVVANAIGPRIVRSIP